MMMESKDIPLDNIEGLRRRKGSTTKVELVKSPGAQFQGSFAAGARKKDWTKENESGIINKAIPVLPLEQQSYLECCGLSALIVNNHVSRRRITLYNVELTDLDQSLLSLWEHCF